MSFSFHSSQEFVKDINDSFSFTDLKPTLRVGVTEKCNLKCPYCHREGITEKYTNYLSPEEYSIIANTFHSLGLSKVKFTGGEPLLRKDLAKIVQAFMQAGFEDLSMITNGTLLNRKNLLELKEAGLNRITISFDSLKQKKATQISGCDCLEKVLENVSLSREFFEDVKVNCVILPGINFPSEILDFANFCRDNDVTLKLLSRLSDDTPYPLCSQALVEIKLYKHLKRKEICTEGVVPATKYFFSDGTKVEVNDFRSKEYRRIISNNKSCESCELKEQCVEGPYAIRVMPDGEIKPCLLKKDNTIKFRKVTKSRTKLICLTGLASSGKSNFTKTAENMFNIKNVYVGKILKDKAGETHAKPTYDNVMTVSKEIYKEKGPLGTILESFHATQGNITDEKVIILDSVRSVEEYNFLKQFFKTYLVGVICNRSERFKRAKKGYFKLTKDQLIKRDKLELGEENDEPSFNIGELLGHVDYYILGESQNFKQETAEIIKAIMNDRS